MSLPVGIDTQFLLPPSTLHRRPNTAHHHHRAWKRRRLKRLLVRNSLNPTPSPFGDLFHSLLSQFPSVNSLNFIAPALGLALTLSYSSRKLLRNPSSVGNSNYDIGEWILFTSPTPFNRFVTLRCPSIHFPGNELLERVNEKLVREDRHYVNLSSGRMIQSDGDVEEKMVYQRVCVATEDGGVLSLDWPANLELEEERGLDTTVLIVPGTCEGSNERKIRVLVCDCLRRGVFPVVMNPRGCADSPLTTARLFTAADSDDISTAIQYINKKRPWTTLMGVGWGYGANMLTKYLAESGERTPLTAATCIDNPFDLEEALRSSVYHNTDFSLRHIDGLIKILHCNKELFQGRGKGFDVERALSASSIRDFDRAISMVSYGYDTIEEFYAKSGTRDVVGKVKVPVLFIQNDDGKVPLFSIPRSSIAENPYTSLLLCSYSSSSKIMDDILSFSWCQNLTLEWLAAVELGLLKGRHPLLEDVDVTINPTKGLGLVESRASNKRERIDKLLNMANGNSAVPTVEMSQANDNTSIHSRFTKDIGKLPPITKELQQEDNDVGKQSMEEGMNASDNEKGQVLQTAKVVMNMLDVTLPDTLTDDQKKEVLNAVGQGETVMKALQSAVPEDVRGKLTTAVSGILQSRGSNLKFDKLLKLGQIPDVASGLNSKVLEKAGPVKANEDEDVHSLEQKKRINDPGDDCANADHSNEKAPRHMDLEKQSSEISQNSSETDMLQSTSNHGSNTPDLEKGNLSDMENEKLSGGSTAQKSDKEKVSEIISNQELSGMVEDPNGAEENVADQKNVERGNVKTESDQKEETSKQNNDSSSDQNKMSETHRTEDNSSAPSPASETQVIKNQAENSQNDEKGQISSSSQNSGDSPSFGVSQAFDALTGFDDSTQVAVNSVFHVIEDMIDQLEVDKDSGDKMNNENNLSEANGMDEIKVSDGAASKNQLTKNNDKSARTITQSGISVGTPLYDPAGSTNKDKQYSTHGNHYNIISDTDDTRIQSGNRYEIGFAPSSGELSERDFVKFLNGSSEKLPNCLTAAPYGDPLYKEYLKMRKAKPLDMDKMSAVYLEYIPEESQWKLLEQKKYNGGPAEQKEYNGGPADENASREGGYNEDQVNTRTKSKYPDSIIEPSYVILDSSTSGHQSEELKEMDIVNENSEFHGTEFGNSMLLVKNLIIECLNVEVGRRASVADMEELELTLAREIEHVANAVSMAAVHKGNENLLEKLGTLDGDNIIKAISSAVQNTRYLKSFLPVGVVVGASLAALRKSFDVATLDGNDEKNSVVDQVNKSTGELVQVGEKENNEKVLRKRDSKNSFSGSIYEEDQLVRENSQNRIMVGAVTAALGASALLAHQPDNETGGSPNEPLKESENGKEPSKLDEMSDKTQNNIVTSLAEKAMSVASPVMPVKEDGEVDHERLVSMLAELGQKGGMLRLVGKVALLWGGLRGAMSLTDKLISFLHIAERPLLQRILGFVFLVLLLWSPVILPLLPTLMQSWATGSSLKIAEFACIAGLYVSIMIMITLWGKRIRKYDDPLQQYGLDLASVPKFLTYLRGLFGGVVLVILIHAVNSSLGYAHLSWPATLSSSASEPVALIKSYGQMLMLIVQGICTATGVSAVEEVFFRSWLPQEIAADFGYLRGIIISGLVFALSQRSMWEVPGLWLLSLALSGARQKSGGSLSLPVGLRAGILSSNLILKTGRFLTYHPNLPLWVTGGHPFQPFSGAVGLAFSLLLALVLYPRDTLHQKKLTRVIRD